MPRSRKNTVEGRTQRWYPTFPAAASLDIYCLLLHIQLQLAVEGFLLRRLARLPLPFTAITGYVYFIADSTSRYYRPGCYGLPGGLRLPHSAQFWLNLPSHLFFQWLICCCGW